MRVAPGQYVLLVIMIMIVAVVSAVLMMMPIRVCAGGFAGLVMMVRMIVMTTRGLPVMRGVIMRGIPLNRQRF
jgi:hypothetical protein